MKERGVRGAQDPGHGLVVDEHGAAVAALYDVLHDCQRVGGVVRPEGVDEGSMIQREGPNGY